MYQLDANNFIMILSHKLSTPEDKCLKHVEAIYEIKS